MQTTVEITGLVIGAVGTGAVLVGGVWKAGSAFSRWLRSTVHSTVESAVELANAKQLIAMADRFVDDKSCADRCARIEAEHKLVQEWMRAERESKLQLESTLRELATDREARAADREARARTVATITNFQAEAKEAAP